jgi:trehalose-phosphatase
LLPAALVEIRDRVRGASRLALFLDFDGTLAPFVDDPDAAQLDQPTRKILKALSLRDDLLLVIISGRSLSDLRARVGIENAVYAGNHGLEIGGPGMRFIEPLAAAERESLAKLCEILAWNLRGIAGVRVEDKGLTASIHYRLATPDAARDVERISEAVTSALSPFRLETGKAVVDILPRTAWNKGAAVKWIQSRVPGGRPLSIYLGDDRTDEYAFRSLLGGITIHVGNPGETCAQYHVWYPSGVRNFLGWLNRIR